MDAKDKKVQIQEERITRRPVGITMIVRIRPIFEKVSCQVKVFGIV